MWNDNSRIPRFFMIHIGQLIKQELEHQERTPSWLARKINCERPNVYNIFERNLNKTPNEIKQQILCEKAIRLLTTTSLSVEEISSQLQFSSSSYFRKILKKHTKKTPSMIRKENFM